MATREKLKQKRFGRKDICIAIYWDMGLHTPCTFVPSRWAADCLMTPDSPTTQLRVRYLSLSGNILAGLQVLHISIVNKKQLSDNEEIYSLDFIVSDKFLWCWTTNIMFYYICHTTILGNSVVVGWTGVEFDTFGASSRFPRIIFITRSILRVQTPATLSLWSVKQCKGSWNSLDNCSSYSHPENFINFYPIVIR